MIYQVALDDAQVSMTAEAIAAAWRTGRVHPHTLVWREGLQDWTPLAQLKDEIAMPHVATAAAVAAGVRGALAAERARRSWVRGRIIGTLALMLAAAITIIAVGMYLRSDEDKRVSNLKHNAEYLVANTLNFPETAEVTIEQVTRYKPTKGNKFGSVKFEGTVIGRNAFNVPIRKLWSLTYDADDVPTGVELF